MTGAATGGAGSSGVLNSGFIALLPGLEQTALYGNLTTANLTTAASSPTVLATKNLAPFICPSDGNAAGTANTDQSRTSYRLNLGSGGYVDNAAEVAGTFTNVSVTGAPTSGATGNGPFKVLLNGDATSGHPGDGFSNTLFFTEKRIARNTGSGPAGTAENSGLLFASGYPVQTGVSTNAKPGSTSTSVGTTNYTTAAGGASATAGFFASSYHTNGVNSSFGDGAGKFINTSIDAGLWASLGTATGGEAATPP
jgi:hypothetical protein